MQTAQLDTRADNILVFRRPPAILWGAIRGRLESIRASALWTSGMSSLAFAVASGSIGSGAMTVGFCLYRTLLEMLADGARRSAGERWFVELNAWALRIFG